jgi:hypothetical protein
MGPSQPPEIGEFRPEDAEGIAHLFRAVYGEGYPIKVFYDPKALIEANETGRYHSIVARAPDGTVVGAQHLFRSAPYERVYEAGAGLVLKDYRKLGLNARMLHFAFQEWVPKQPTIEEVFGEPVCNHVTMQKSVESFGYVEMGLEVALMPAEAYDAERSAAGRVAALVAFRTYRPKPHKVFLPPCYEELLRFLYASLDDQREFETAEADLANGQASRAQMTVFDFARVARIAVHEPGNDFASRVTGLETQAVNQGVVVLQIWISLGSMFAGAAADILRRQGYFFGGLLPRWFDCDGLLMQKLLCTPNFETIQLHSSRAHQIFDIVKQDWEEASSGGSSGNHLHQAG